MESFLRCVRVEEIGSREGAPGADLAGLAWGGLNSRGAEGTAAISSAGRKRGGL